MTAITIAPRQENPGSDVESVVTAGYVQIRISTPVSAGGQWLLPIWSDPITFAGSPVVVQLDPQATVAYEARFHLPNGDGDWLDFSEFRKVVDATPRAWDTLELVGAPGSSGSIPSDITARLAALEAAVASISGGASTLATITDMSPFARTLNDDTSATAARATLGVPAVGDAPTTHTHPVPGGLVATGTASNTTFLRGDGAWAAPTGVVAGSVAYSSITGLPATFPPTAQSVTWLTDMTATGEAIAQAASAATVAGLVEPYIQLDAAAPTYVTIYCPGDVDKPRRHPATGAVLPDAPACIVLWRKATFPTVATQYAQNLDDYRPWGG